MARRYVRDARGRFASKGYSGQTSVANTARGGKGSRLMAPGKQRAGGGQQIRAARQGSTVGKPRGLKPQPLAAAMTKKRRVLVKADGRPRNVFSRATKRAEGYGQDPKANVANAMKEVQRAGFTSSLKSNKNSSSVAHVLDGTQNVVFNRSHGAWKDPRGGLIKARRRNEFSTASPGHYVAHELGHIKNPAGRMAASWTAQAKGKDWDARIAARDANWKVANRVSQYAKKSPAEFAAETSAALRLGKRYDREVMSLYREVTNRPLPNLRGQLRSQGATPGFVSPRAGRRRRRKP